MEFELFSKEFLGGVVAAIILMALIIGYYTDWKMKCYQFKPATGLGQSWDKVPAA